MLFESTIWHGISGPQWNLFNDARLTEYRAGGRVIICPYTLAEKPVDATLLNATENLVVLRKSGQCPYAVAHLFGDFFDDTPLSKFFSGFGADLMKTHGLVCSEALAMVTGHIPFLGVTPAQMAALKCYDAPIQALP